MSNYTPAAGGSQKAVAVPGPAGEDAQCTVQSSVQYSTVQSSVQYWRRLGDNLRESPWGLSPLRALCSNPFDTLQLDVADMDKVAGGQSESRHYSM